MRSPSTGALRGYAHQGTKTARSLFRSKDSPPLEAREESELPASERKTAVGQRQGARGLSDASGAAPGCVQLPSPVGHGPCANGSNLRQGYHWARIEASSRSPREPRTRESKRSGQGRGAGSVVRRSHDFAGPAKCHCWRPSTNLAIGGQGACGCPSSCLLPLIERTSTRPH